MRFLMCGDIVKMQQHWLVIDCSELYCLFVRLNTSKLRFLVSKVVDIQHAIEKDIYSLIPHEDIEDDNDVLVSDSEKAKLIEIRNEHMADELLSYQDNYFWLANRDERADFINMCAEKFHICQNTVRRFMRAFLQNGMSLHGLECKYGKCGGKGKNKNYTSGKKPGRKGESLVARTAEVIKQFDFILERYKRLGTRTTFEMLYIDLCREFYLGKNTKGVKNILDEISAVDRPSKKQLYYYIKTHLSDEEAYIAKFGKRKAKNDIRALKSDTISDLANKTIGDRFEIDEQETDFYLVSQFNSDVTIGRSVLYFIVDTFSKMIVGFYLGLENNSWAGASMALLNLSENKVDFCKRAGIEISEDDWPVCNVLPRQIIADNGSEYLSNSYKRFGHENGIHISLVPPATGSYKPNVEQAFNQFNHWVKGYLLGEIYKDGYGKSHLKTAKLTLNDMREIVIQFILHYNRSPKKDYPQDVSILSSKTLPSPLDIWKLKMENGTSLKTIPNINRYRMSMLIPGTAKITRSGIKFKRRLYINTEGDWLEPEMVDAKFNKDKRINIRYDKNNVNIIFVEYKGTIKRCMLNSKKHVNEIYAGRSYDECRLIDALLDNQKKLIDDIRLAERIDFNNVMEAVVENAMQRDNQNKNHKKIREARKEEKEYERSISTIGILSEEKTLDELPVKEGIPNMESILILEDTKEDTLAGIDINSLSTEEKIKLYEKMLV